MSLSIIDKLLIVQDRDRALSRLNRESRDIPLRKQQIEQKIEGARKALLAAQDELKKKMSAAKQLELDVATHQERISKLRMQQTQVKTNVEYRSLESEIKGAQAEITKVEDGELELMEQIEQVRKHVAVCDAEVKQQEKDIKAELGTLEHRLKEIAGEVDVIQQDRNNLVKDIPRDWLDRYDKVFSHNGEYGLAALDHGACGGCHMKLPAQAVHDARRIDRIILCNYCGAILYWRP